MISNSLAAAQAQTLPPVVSMDMNARRMASAIFATKLTRGADTTSVAALINHSMTQPARERAANSP